MASTMFEIFDTTTIITIAIAIFILIKLRSVLGTRTGHEKPPFEPYEIDRKTKQAKPANDDNVIEMPSRKKTAGDARKVTTSAQSPSDQAINEYAKSGTKLNRGLKQIAKSDSSFSPYTFVDGAKMAYEMIVTSFADGDRKTLKNLLSKEVYEGFADAITDRENRKETVQSSFVGIEEAGIKSSAVVDNEAQITVEFVSDIISATIDSKGEIIDGDPDEVAVKKDIWTFARDIRSKDPNWKLVATESES